MEEVAFDRETWAQNHWRNCVYVDLGKNIKKTAVLSQKKIVHFWENIFNVISVDFEGSADRSNGASASAERWKRACQDVKFRIGGRAASAATIERWQRQQHVVAIASRSHRKQHFSTTAKSEYNFAPASEQRRQHDGKWSPQARLAGIVVRTIRDPG